MRGAARDRPVADGLGHRGGDVGVELLSEADGGAELGEDVLRQLGAHLLHTKGVDAEELRDAGLVARRRGRRLGAASRNRLERRAASAVVRAGHEGRSGRRWDGGTTGGTDGGDRAKSVPVGKDVRPNVQILHAL